MNDQMEVFKRLQTKPYWNIWGYVLWFFFSYQAYAKRTDPITNIMYLMAGLKNVCKGKKRNEFFFFFFFDRLPLRMRTKTLREENLIDTYILNLLRCTCTCVIHIYIILYAFTKGADCAEIRERFIGEITFSHVLRFTERTYVQRQQIK